jgi:signal transduction histidine kinase
VTYLFYIRLIGLTAGTLTYLFLLALILGHRRPRFFERLLFFLTLSLFLAYAGGLLELNALIQYGVVPRITHSLSAVLFGLGVLFLPALLVHVPLAYSRDLERVQTSLLWRGGLAVLYVAPFIPFFVLAFLNRNDLARAPAAARFQFVPLLNFAANGSTLLLLTPAVLLSAGFDLALWKRSEGRMERQFFRRLCETSFVIFLALLAQAWSGSLTSRNDDATAVIVLSVVPGALLIYYALKHNFLEYGAQQNLVYALSATFLALLYLAFVHRVSGWLEPVLPPEATASILLFVLIFLFEPLERVIGPALHRRFQERVGRLQQLSTELQTEARNGNIAELVAFAERRIREEFGLGVVRISVPRDPALAPLESPGGLGHVTRMQLMKNGSEIGLLEAATTGSYLTGETSAALEFLAEQLPGSIDLCRMIGEKLQLERVLAERERMAGLGQMAATISHNLRNPLSSMKTVLQVQLENPDLPVDARRDCSLVVNEIDRMSAKLTQLLRYAKPSVNGERVAAVALARQTASLFGRDAERRNIRMEFDQPREEIFVQASEDSLGEVLSNLIVNAMEAQPNGGRVRVGLSSDAGWAEIRVDDDGPGISEELRGRIFQPYFTTKPTGTGLGLSIVARRIAEMGGTLASESPLRNGAGTRFRFTVPIAKEE